jgi:hypothetical protein
MIRVIGRDSHVANLDFTMRSREGCLGAEGFEEPQSVLKPGTAMVAAIETLKFGNNAKRSHQRQPGIGEARQPFRQNRYIFHAGSLRPVANLFAASRSARSARWAYRAVVWGSVCPSNFPTMCSDSPLETRCDAKVCRRS